jgi:transposase-like protein
MRRKRCLISTHQFRKFGTYQIKDTNIKVQRYRCKLCDQTISDQSYAENHKQHLPNFNAKVLENVSYEKGTRTIARELGINRKTVRRKIKILMNKYGVKK